MVAPVPPIHTQSVTPAAAATNTSATASTAPPPPPPPVGAATANPSPSVPALLSSTRLERTTACLPIVYGSFSVYLGKKADDYQSHEWTLFVKGPHDDDLTGVISKVVFHLHASFTPPTRELTQPPFEVTERGWGEFDAQISIYWTDPQEKPILLTKLIKLYPTGSPPNYVPPSDTMDPIVSEIYDEVVFTDPHETFYQQLLHVSALPPTTAATEDDDEDNDIKMQDVSTLTAAADNSTDTVGNNRHLKTRTKEQFLTKSYDDQEDFLALIEAQKFLKNELTTVKSRFEVVTTELQTVDQALIVAQQKHKEALLAAAAASAATAPTTTTGRKTKTPTARKPRPPAQKKVKT